MAVGDSMRWPRELAGVEGTFAKSAYVMGWIFITLSIAGLVVNGIRSGERQEHYEARVLSSVRSYETGDITTRVTIVSTGKDVTLLDSPQGYKAGDIVEVVHQKEGYVAYQRSGPWIAVGLAFAGGALLLLLSVMVQRSARTQGSTYRVHGEIPGSGEGRGGDHGRT